jgi:diguanylate cyclase (GGDEF)-like protein/PAS domain S-box-containing protein
MTMAETAHETFFFDDDEETGLGAAQETQKALIDTQERMGMMLDVMPMGLLIHTQQGILFANQEACGMLQITKPQAIGHHFLDFVGSHEFESVRRQLDDSFHSETSMHKQDTTIARTDGSQISIKLLSCRLPWQGTPVIQVLLQDVTDLKMKEQKLHLLTITDELTGAYNRRHLFDVAAMVMEGTDDPDFALSVVSLDIDHFKKINDTYGHAVGDIALKRLAHVSNEVIAASGNRESLFARIGGEEFLLLLPRTVTAQAEILAEQLRSAIAAIHIETPDCRFGFTASMGVASYCAADNGFDGLLSRGDLALYEAKRRGRNRVVVA